MEPYAVVETGGKQYRVRRNDKLSVERLPAEAGQSLKLAPVLAVNDGEKLLVGAPAVEGAAVTATVLEHTRGDKVVAFKKKRRKGYSRKTGHRQELTVVKIDAIESAAAKPATEEG